MNRLLVSRVLSLGLLVVLVVLALSAWGGDEKKAKARALPEEEKALRPGTYRSEEFRPSFSFRVGKGWSSAPQEASDVLAITRGQTAGFVFLNVQEVYKPTGTGTPNLMNPPKDIDGWLQQHPYLQTSKPEPVRVGGVKGLQLEVVVGDRPQTYIGRCTAIVGKKNCVDLFRLSTGVPIFLVEGEKAGSIVLEGVEGETVTIGFNSPASEFDEFAPEVQKVLESVEWRGS